MTETRADAVAARLAGTREVLARRGIGAAFLETRRNFAWLTAELCGLAERQCGGHVVSMLEGGYDLEALASSTAAHVRVLMRA